MSKFVAILEDDPNRVAAMRACLIDMPPDIEAVFFDHAGKMIAWLARNIEHVALLSLDHDLPLYDDGGERTDCGTGRQVADYLAGLTPTCPVIVHSSNDFCAPGMIFALKDAGWPCSRVYPCDDTAWIADAWAEQVTQYVDTHRRNTPTLSPPPESP